MHEGAQSCRPYLPFSSTLATRVRISAVSVGFFKVFDFKGATGHIAPASTTKLFRRRRRYDFTEGIEREDTRVSRRGPAKARFIRRFRRVSEEENWFERITRAFHLEGMGGHFLRFWPRIAFHPRVPRAKRRETWLPMRVSTPTESSIFKKKEEKNRVALPFKVNALLQSWRTWLNSLSLSLSLFTRG